MLGMRAYSLFRFVKVTALR